MAQVLVNMPEEMKKAIPYPQSPWIRDTIQQRLDREERERFKPFCFVIRGHFVMAVGQDKSTALRNIRMIEKDIYDNKVVTKHGTIEVAKAEGWYAGELWPEDPMVINQRAADLLNPLPSESAGRVPKWYFNDNGRILVAEGDIPATAAAKLGLTGLVLDYKNEEEARQAGWLTRLENQKADQPMDL